VIVAPGLKGTAALYICICIYMADFSHGLNVKIMASENSEWLLTLENRSSSVKQ